MPKGGIIGVDNTPTLDVASGIWKLNEVFKYVTEEIWPGCFSAIEFVGTATTQGGNATSMSVPSGMQEGDILFHVCSLDSGTPALIYASGFTQIATYSAPYGEISYKVMGATPDTSITWTGGELDDAHIAFAVRNVHNTNVEDVATPTVVGDTAGMPNAPSITPSNDNCCVIIFGALDDDVVAASVTAPTGFTLIAAEEGGSASNGSTVMAAYKLQTTAAAVDAAAFGGTGTDAWKAGAIALRHDGVIITEYLVDSHGTEYYVQTSNFGAANAARSQSFTCSANRDLSKMKFYLSNNTGGTGTFTAKLYSHSGTLGSTSVPGTLLATSDSVNVSTIGTSLELVEFTFPSGQNYSMVNGTNYCAVIEASVPSDNLQFGREYPITTGHAGNYAYYSTSWAAAATVDVIFYVYGT